jgi:formiminotetrahydrofolate cyclodeaminase
MLARTAVVGALFNVKINLASIKDESYVSELEKRVEKLESDAIFCEKSILCLSKLSDTVYNR